MEYVELLKYTWSSIFIYFDYHNILNENRTVLREKRKRLECREQDINTELENAQYCHGKKAKREVENWLMEVQLVKGNAQQIEQEVEERRYFSRLRFLSQFEAHTRKLDEMFELGNFPSGVLIDVHEDVQNALLTAPLIGETTAKRNFEKIWTCLENGEIQTIGVWGMGGIGKTTVVTHIHNRLLKNKHTFGLVYWVTVSQDSSIHKLQDAIAGKINLDLSEKKDEKIRAAFLSKALQAKKKFVLIFDDIWEVYTPLEVGIPIGVGGGKLIITTRSREVCLKMGCKEIVKVEPLSGEEAWELFNKTLDRYNALSQKEEEIAKGVVQECAGLPLAIVTTASSMSVMYDVTEWRNALNELRGHVKGHTIDVENDVFKILEFSYSRLNDQKLQECLLYCALFPEDCMIRREFLINYWIVEGLVEDMGSRVSEHDRGHAILNKLENLCLLERCENGKSIKMHDVVRDMAINITRRNSRFMVKTGRKIEDLPDELEWPYNLERVSLVNRRLSITSMSVPNCPKLTTLFLQKLNGPLVFSLDKDLPNSFFMHMVGLRVLDLSHTSMTFLPDSIYDMVNLRALILCDCRALKEVGSLAKLKELRKLDLCRNNLERLPDGIEKLGHLKEFNWTIGSGCKGGLQPPAGPVSDLLPNLVHLQCLILHDTRLKDAGMEELSGLRKLEVLSISFSNINNFNSYVRMQHYQRLGHYHLQLNRKGRGRYDHIFRYCKEVEIRFYRLIGGKETDDEYQQPVLPSNLRVLDISCCQLPNSLLDISPSLKKAMDLKACEIRECGGMEYVWWADNYIASLNTLYLRELPNLRVLFKYLRPKPGPTENIVSCSNLKHLFVGKCGNLKHLFTVELVKYHLQNLQTIFVYDCSQMEDIIVAAEEEEEGNIKDLITILNFPNLMSFKLAQLPKQKSIWKGKMTCDSLQRLAVGNCPKLRRFPLSVHVTIYGDGDGDGEIRASSPPLKEIRADKDWLDAVEWDSHPLLKSLFEPLFKPVKDQSTPHSWFTEFMEDYKMNMEENDEV